MSNEWRMCAPACSVLAAFALFAGASSAGAAVVPTIDFNLQSDYDGNFRETFGQSAIGWNAAGHVRYAPPGDNSTAIIRYDTNPATAAHDSNDFLTETLSVDVTFSTFGNASAGLFARIQSNNLGILALVNTISSTSAQLRLFYNADTATTAAGTTFFNATFNLATGDITYAAGAGATGSTNSLDLGSPITLVLTQTDDADPVFNLTLSDADGLIASTGNQVLSSALTNAYDSAGSVGMRLNLPLALSGGVQNTITIDNFAASAVPEPGALVLAAAAVPFALRRRARAC